MNADPSFHRALASFVATAPDAWAADVAWPRVRLALLDTLAVSVAAIGDPAFVAALRYSRLNGGASEVPHVWVTPSAATLEDAAFVAAVAAHALDYDDVAPAWRGHPSAVMLPALAAVARIESDATGEALARAYVVGFEIGVRIGAAVAGRHYERGWHSTSTVGVVAATAACARLAGLDTEAVSNALALAVAQAAGVQANFGTSAKAMHAGFAASAALRACRLAASGVSGSSHALDGPHGFADLMANMALDTRALVELGASIPGLATSGLETKLYPLCYAAHRALEAAITLRKRGTFSCEDIIAIEIVGTPGAHAPLLNRLPNTAAEARFSAEYAVACALVEGGVGLASFEREPASLSQHAALMARTRVGESGPRSPIRAGTVRLRLHDGRVLEETVTSLRGNLPGDVAEGDILAKADDCLRSVAVQESAAAVLAAIDSSRAVPLRALFDDGPLAQIREGLSGHLGSKATVACGKAKVQ
jgi:2-methylcitrate dehydratase PrpD